MEQFGLTTDLAVIEQLVPISGMRLADVGCGPGDLTRALAERGADMLGLEPDPRQAALNREAPPMPRVRFVEGSADDLPANDGSLDGVFFGRSLHHIPQARMRASLRNARRAVQAESGFVYVLEPIMEGAFSDVLRHFHDETAVRRQAIDALQGLVPSVFAATREVRYEIMVQFDDYNTFVSRFVAMAYNLYAPEAVRAPIVERAFETGRMDTGGYQFVQPMRVNLFHAGDDPMRG